METSSQYRNKFVTDLVVLHISVSFCVILKPIINYRKYISCILQLHTLIWLWGFYLKTLILYWKVLDVEAITKKIGNSKIKM